MTIRAERVSALNVCNPKIKDVRSGVEGRKEYAKPYVMRMAVSIWKNSPNMLRKPEMNAPILVQRANKPVTSEQTAKKRPISTKANMKRVR